MQNILRKEVKMNSQMERLMMKEMNLMKILRRNLRIKLNQIIS